MATGLNRMKPEFLMGYYPVSPAGDRGRNQGLSTLV